MACVMAENGGIFLLPNPPNTHCSTLSYDVVCFFVLVALISAAPSLHQTWPASSCVWLSTHRAALTRRDPCPDGVNTTTHPACCMLFLIVDSLQEDYFDGGECGEDADGSHRLTFTMLSAFRCSKGPSGCALPSFPCIVTFI